jgi:membrane-associated phospholipid phosphatase
VIGNSIGVFLLCMKLAKHIYFTLMVIAIDFASCSAQTFHADIALLEKINSQESNFGDHAFALLSASATPVALGTPLVNFSIGILKKDKNIKKKSLLMGVQLASAMAVSSILKYSIGRTRPYDAYTTINNKAQDFTPSFPSGHTTSAFATATSISLAWPRWYVIAPSYLWAASVGYSRLYLGVHYPTDVLAGALLGTSTSWLTWKVNHWLRKSIENKKTKLQKHNLE